MLRRPTALLLIALLPLVLSSCSPVLINGSLQTQDNHLCIIRPQQIEPDVHNTLIHLLRKKGFSIREFAPSTKPDVCRQTLVYQWSKTQYYIPAYIKQYAINLDVYVDNKQFANASFDPDRNFVGHVKFIRFSRYLARTLDKLFPGRTLIGN